ncbi:hypothetical protein ES332_D11G282700v1 [Gossypium tomentosum]|uniref:Uncharacterized protein n=1 Tax=Gossypium tomentosum TaxID=34277 RepID=A0A5D2ITJ2_GOSTO|nr:hypothetical protein ES332_D11G282700v1 [Gossypium tomentosum]
MATETLDGKKPEEEEFAEKDRGSALAESSIPDSHGDSGLQNVINYLRRTKQIVLF